MNCCRNNCVYLAIIIGILAGVVLGVLSALGFISTGVIYWVYAIVGVLGILLSPLYAQVHSEDGERCFCFYRRLILTAAIGTIISSVVGLVLSSIAGTITLAIVTAVATFFLAALLVSVLCLSGCICSDN